MDILGHEVGDLGEGDIVTSVVLVVEVMSCQEAESYLVLRASEMPAWTRIAMLRAMLVGEERAFARSLIDEAEE